jgi:hypothetical protein
MPPIAHPGRLLKRELEARKLSANRLSLDIGGPSGRIAGCADGRQRREHIAPCRTRILRAAAVFDLAHVSPR